LRQPFLTCSAGYGRQVQCTHTSTQDDLFNILANELLPSNEKVMETSRDCAIHSIMH